MDKAIYGLKQAVESGTQNLMNFMPLENERCLYKCNKKGKILFIAVYVDGIIIASELREYIRNFKEEFSNHFDYVDKGELDYFLGTEI